MISLSSWCQEQHRPELLECYLDGDNPISPDLVGFSSGKAVRWKCRACGLTWMASPNKMNRKPKGRSVCPFCSHERPSYQYNAAILYPEMLPYWDDGQNQGALADYLPRSGYIAHWRCGQGHSWTRPIIDQAVAIERRRTLLEEDLCPYCSRRRASPSYNLETVCPEVAREWCYEKNGALTPSRLSPYSQHTVFWQCRFDPTHIWAERVSNRTVLLRSCPECTRRFRISYAARSVYYYLHQAGLPCEYEVPAGRYRIDIEIRPPAPAAAPIALEMDGYPHRAPEAAAREAKKDAFLRGKGYRVIRIKELDSESEGIQVKEDTITYPYSDQNRYLNGMLQQALLLIAGIHIQPDHVQDHWKIEDLYFHTRRERSLAALYPELAQEWSNRNPDAPEAVSPGMNAKRWWTCPKCSREYQATLSNRTRSHSGCPYCSHLRVTPETCLAAKYPEIAAQWDQEKNAPLKPTDVLPGTGKRVWWKCSQGHSWQTAVCMRTGPKATKCPFCQGRLVNAETSLAGRFPELALYWHPTKNVLSPTQVAPFCNTAFWWRCPAGHEWQAPPNKVQKYPAGRLCPYCDHRRLWDNAIPLSKTSF